MQASHRMTLASTTSIFELFIQLDSQEHQWFCNEIMNDYCNFIRVSHNTDAERNDCFIDYRSRWIFLRFFFNHTGQKSQDNGKANRGPPGPPGPPGVRGPKGKQ